MRRPAMGGRPAAEIRPAGEGRPASVVRPALGLLCSALLLSACVQAGPVAPPPPRLTVAPPPPRPQGPPQVALLLPLTGQYAAIAASMSQAAQLAASSPGAPRLDIRDTGGDPQRAGAAAQAAIEAGDTMILGPLTAEETQAVSGVAGPAGIPVLAFSSDPSVAAPGVWTLGITPAQQMRRLVAAARAEGRQHLAALLPEGAFGDALQTALVDAASEAGFEPPAIQRAGTDEAGLDSVLKTLTEYETRHDAVEERIRAMRQSTDPASRQQAAILAAQPPAPPPFDTLVLGANGDALRLIAGKLLSYDVVAPQVRLLGPSFWASGAAQSRKLAGAWYAVPDPTERAGFVSAYSGKYGAAPPPIADIAFDAALIGRALAQEHNVSVAALTRPEGFSGVDGAIVLQPDGHVRRALAIYQVSGTGVGMLVSAAPADLSVPGS